MSHAAQRVGSEYDDLASKFEKWKPSQQLTEVFTRTVINGLAEYQQKELTVLDAGCGHGTWLTRVVDYCKQNEIRARFLGVDVSERRVELARHQLATGPNMQLIHGDIQTCRLPESLDLVYSIEVFQHLSWDQQHDALVRWSNALSDVGSIVIIDKDEWSWHSVKVRLQQRTGALGRRVFRMFPAEYDSLFSTIRYPSFVRLAEAGRELGLFASEIVNVREFSGLKMTRMEKR